MVLSVSAAAAASQREPHGHPVLWCLRQEDLYGCTCFDGVSGGRTTKQLDWAVAARSPEPCQGMRRTVAWSQLASRCAGRKRVMSAAGSACGERAWAKRGAEGGFAGERAEDGRGEEQEGDHRRDGVSGQAEEGKRAAALPRELAEDGGLAGLDAHAGEVEDGAALGECLLDEVVFAGGDASGEEQKVAGLLRGIEERAQIVEVVAGDTEANGFAAGERTWAASEALLELRIWWGWGAEAISTSSSPVARMATRGFAKTRPERRRRRRAAAMWLAARRVPAATSGSPERASLPAGTMWLPGRSLRPS